MAELCDAYIEDAASGRILTRRGVAKKATTIETDRSRISGHIKPLIGALKVPAVSRDDVEAFMYDIAAGKGAGKAKTGKKRGLSNIRGGKGAATRTLGLLGAIFTYAVRNQLRADNPVHGLLRFADGRRERRLSEAEYAALGTALDLAVEAKIWPPAIAAARFLVLTGWRSGEATGLRWDEVDVSRRTARLADTKSGFSIRPLSEDACAILRAQTKAGDLVFPASRGKGKMSGFPSVWERIIGLGGISAEITPNVLRHSFASLASDLGYSEASIAALVGHKRHSITSRYVHAADAILLAAADAVAEKTVSLMEEACGVSPQSSKA
ncbi:tyrosine-type recombinase/integrase [Acidisoma cladoniae]|uniref:tyrosine-type recombinase/integrase n=1 Tax=Acidisoma cladoniae TaxID=3040935 RepID=UPI002549E76D|nr:site-specific integrase [Acidisoma sp. PAMC 29798]